MNYETLVNTPSDINEHMPTLKELASHCKHITEFGTRSGNSTVALLAGLKKTGKLVSYDINDCSGILDDPRWTFKRADTGTLFAIDKTDMLFIDTLHDYAQVKAELEQARFVTNYLAFHDTVLFGSRDESTGQGPGIMQAILELMTEDPDWRVQASYPNNNGLLVLYKLNV